MCNMNRIYFYANWKQGDGLETTVTHAHQTLDLLDSVTGGLDPAVTLVLEDGLDPNVMSAARILDLLDNVTGALLVGLVTIVTIAQDSDSAQRVTAVNAYRTPTGKDTQALHILMFIWRSHERHVQTWFLVGLSLHFFILFLCILLNLSYYMK